MRKKSTTKKHNRIPFLSMFILLGAFGILGCSSDSKEGEEKKTDPKAGNNLRMGASANDLLSDEKYSSMVIEVGYDTDAEPSDEALDELKDFLETYTNKPGGISFVKTPISVPGDGSITTVEAGVIENTMRTQYNSGKKVAVFLFFVNGTSATSGGNNVLGTAYKNTSIVLFKQSIREIAETASVSEAEVTANTLKHEFGHLFGLVGNGSQAQSEHSAPNYHCNVSGCLMATTVEYGKSAVEYIKSGENGEFDEKCHQDLQANGGK